MTDEQGVHRDFIFKIYFYKEYRLISKSKILCNLCVFK